MSALWLYLTLCAGDLHGLASVTIRTSNLEAARQHYQQHLGFAMDGAGTVTVNPEQRLYIVAGLGPQDDTRMMEAAFAVTDLKALRARLHRARLKTEPAADGAFVLRDASGNLLRFQAPRRQPAAPSAAAISQHLEHIGLLVHRRELASAEKLYGEILGLKEVWRYAPQGQLRLIKYACAGPRGDIVELMIHDGGLNRQRIGSMSHVNFAVSDIHATHRALLARGAQPPQPSVNAEQIWAMNLFDPDGTRTELQDTTKIPPATIEQTTLHGRPGWTLSNGWMQVTVLRGGGHIAEARLLNGNTVNPMRVPHYPTIDPHTYDPARHDEIYGNDSHRWLSSGYMGHLLCFPWYGPPSSPEEIQAGVGNHGEAPIVEWKEIRREVTNQAAIFTYGADLPRSRFRAERRVTLRRGLRQATVEEWVENLQDHDRPIQWMQHATFGPPFIQAGKNRLRLSATQASDGVTQDRVMPATDKTGSYTALLMDARRPHQFFTVRNLEQGLTIGYVYPTEGNLWLGDWQENKRNAFKPWNSQVTARGIEFGSSPYAEGLRKAIDRGKLFDVPAYRWIGGRQRLKTEFTLFVTIDDPAEVTFEHGIAVLRNP